MIRLSLLFIFLGFHFSLRAQDFSYIPIDSTKQKWGDWNEPNWLRYFGLDAGDMNGDGLLDIASGRYVYQNPGGDMTEGWQRTVLDDNVDAICIMDVDGDPYADIIAQALPDLYWYEATTPVGDQFVRKRISAVPATSHVNSQGFERAQILSGEKEELVIAGNGNIYLLTIPANPSESLPWPTSLIGANTSDEGIGVGDMDGDGDLDIASGRRKKGEDEPTILVWFENEGRGDIPWTDHLIGETKHPIDRVAIGDLNGDKQAEVVITEERYPGLEADAQIIWFSQEDPPTSTWTPHVLNTQYSTNNLDLQDLDADGDLDILTAEHKGEALELQFWMNDGRAEFSKKVIDTGKENHLGAQAFDMDGDGDLDIIGAGWDAYKWMHVWRNNSHHPIDSLHTPLITEYQGKDHYLIQTKHITYYYDLAGGGFSRMIDTNGNDWISFKAGSSGDYPAGAGNVFRGIPNLVFQGEDNGAGHPGFDQCTSWVEAGRLYSESKSKKWKWSWTFYENYAVLDLLKVDSSRTYWFLYEGTPGGRFNPSAYYYGSDLKGPASDTPDFYKGQALFLPLQWAYTGVKGLPSTFYMLHQHSQPQKGILSYLGNSEDGVESKDGMTVFGFGRGENTQALLSSPTRFVIGLYPSEIRTSSDHDEFAQFLKRNFLNSDLR